ncbi:MAG TPA: DUF4870 domain-containing protein [Ktedonobacterales bacterium]|nr:DUF4870 domain-containing protein [Ktedonobacterales bacterium]
MEHGPRVIRATAPPAPALPQAPAQQYPPAPYLESPSYQPAATQATTPGELHAPGPYARVLAATAHMLILFSIPGLILAALIWFSHRGHSRYVAEQARQAVLWQLRINSVSLISVLVLLVVIFTQLGEAIGQAKDSVSLTVVIVALFATSVLLIGGMLFAIASAVIGATSSLLGKEYRYPFLGSSRRSRRRAKR